MAQETKVREEETQREYRNVGKPVTRIEGVGKVTGKTVYADDMQLPRMLHAKVLGSPVRSRTHQGDPHGQGARAPRRRGRCHVRRPARLQEERVQPPRHHLPRRRSPFPRPAYRRRPRERPARRRGSARADRGRLRGAAAGRRPDRRDGRRLAARPLAAHGRGPLRGAWPRHRRRRADGGRGQADERRLADELQARRRRGRLRGSGRRRRAHVALRRRPPELHRAALHRRRLRRLGRALRLDEHAGAVLHQRGTVADAWASRRTRSA